MGLFGPDSVTWKLHREPILMLGGLRSLYMQALHPRAVAGVAQNSGYRTDMWGRLIRTSGYVATVIYGSTAEVTEASARLRRLHAGMRGVDPRTGESFRIDDPDLLRWVHVAEVESFLTTALRAGVRLTPDEIDAYYTEQLRAAALVGLDPATVPGTAAEVADFYAAIRPELGLTRDGAEAAMLLTVPPIPDSWGNRAVRLGLTLGPTRWAYLSLASTAIGLLPPWARRLYGAPGWPVTDLAAGLSARGLRTLLAGVLAVLPDEYRISPAQRAALQRVG
ncbi:MULTISPECIES: oxygenase MpaB family protein [unclassified Actinoplanes]|uniref:oxygenase MpaB family protein n=1 Tax=unclassified Actinoplanes TaxID=2626549 RepID=UPI0002D82CFD|nr:MULTISPECIES: oxygenase MpaB family protein [unclassified Actinoplanes]